ncbi:hypothetical protein [Bacillus sp. REN10]|uniref:hypothetical protein n=1 Tax=Bacillus sp. REN10 TaxID=2782541 RepID=UPI00193AEE64|nr:hypothetical protein [Bacillus sp. REN10]
MQPVEKLKPKWMWFFLLAGVIILGNYSAHHLLTVSSGDVRGMTIGSLVDFVIVLPLLTYFLILRKKWSVVPIIGVAFLGYLAAKMMIPAERLDGMEWIGWVLAAGEVALFSVEIWLIVKVVKFIRSVRAEAQQQAGRFTPAMAVLQQADEKFSGNRLAQIVVSEWVMLKHAFGSWKQKAPTSPQHFTAHQKTSVIAFYVMMIHAIVLETVGVHWLLHSVSPIISWVLLVFNVYGVLFFIGEIQAIRLNRITVDSHEIIIPIGLMKRITVPVEAIRSIRRPESGEYHPKDTTAFHGMYVDFEKPEPQIVIELNEPLTVKYLYGFSKQVEKVYLKLDQPEEFVAVVTKTN